MNIKLSAALCGSASLLALASPALAQQAAAAPPKATQLEEVVVTGTHIRDGFTAPTPETVATADRLEATTPTTIPDALNKLPQFAGSAINAGSSNGTGGGPPSVLVGNFLSLRSLGPVRTLILMDGHRVPPTTLNGQVDTNTLPEMLTQRVDVVTGGASAVYGSDAVTGVVNFILDHKFTGLKVEAQTGISDQHDAPSTKLGVAGGDDVLGRGHVIWSYEHYQNAGIKTHEDRSYSASVPVYTGAGTAANPFVLTQGARLSGATYGGLVTSGPFKGQQFVGSDVLAPFNPGTPTKSNGIAVGGDGAYYTGLALTAPVRTDQLFGRFDYDFDNNVKAYLQVNGTEERSADQLTSNAPPTPFTIFSGNPFLSAGQQALLTTANVPSFTVARLSRDLAADSSTTQTISTFNVTAGLTGTALKDYVWDVYYTHGESRVRSVTYNNINYPRFYAALDAVKDPSGAVVCRVTLTNPGLYPGCTPINLLGNNTASAAAKAYIYDNTQWQALNKIDDVAATISGVAFQNWAGPVSVALNAEFRSQSLVETSNANSLTVPVTTGIRLGAPPTTNWAYATQAPQQGSNSVWEVGAETVFPLLRDLPLVDKLEVNGAARYTDYSSSGPATTWKVGLNYQPIEDLRFRFSESRDIRAPTLADLYAGTTIAILNVNDPHTGVNGVIKVQGGGNPNLVPEVARTSTAGFVYTPAWIPRFSLSFDYYNIVIDNAIGSINGSNTAILQECENSGGTSPVCSTIVRPLPFSDHSAANFPTLVYNLNQNISQTYTHGFDVEARTDRTLSDLIAGAPGHVDLRLLWSHQPVLKSRTYPTSQLTNAAGVAGLSADRVTGTVGYELGPFSALWQARYLSSQARSGNPLQVYAGPDLPAIWYHDVNLTYRFKAVGRDLQAYLIVTNLFNQQPRISPSTTFAGIPGFGSPYVLGDDPVGRYYTVGLRMKY
ncbi:MAG TPA: TonB-dependent receptor [Phenylobacterium sp.]|jgi:iron complex outermembrane receptor protein|uniref:TonB-dependent receptor domain-containing protein n=1 Tax=Phenylobacterium sp. TaxID=1871053 RepID=UPI002BBC8DD4|nr:TonB-dependent receptor [Phenylobacterium sp.]HXA40543.1 TonB-dependent receptor [Phenylobacterium sp.]